MPRKGVRGIFEAVAGVDLYQRLAAQTYTQIFTASIYTIIKMKRSSLTELDTPPRKCAKPIDLLSPEVTESDSLCMEIALRVKAEIEAKAVRMEIGALRIENADEFGGFLATISRRCDALKACMDELAPPEAAHQAPVLLLPEGDDDVAQLERMGNMLGDQMELLRTARTDAERFAAARNVACFTEALNSAASALLHAPIMVKQQHAPPTARQTALIRFLRPSASMPTTRMSASLVLDRLLATAAPTLGQLRELRRLGVLDAALETGADDKPFLYRDARQLIRDNNSDYTPY